MAKKGYVNLPPQMRRYDRPQRAKNNAVMRFKAQAAKKVKKT